MGFNGSSPIKWDGRKEWKDQECGVPIFSGASPNVCKSCLSGWEHPHNFMIVCEENTKLLDQHPELLKEKE
jgi:hypothetical protein